MKQSIALLFLFLIPFGMLCAQEAVPPENEPDPLFSFDLNLAPNTDGALEGSIELGILYSPWVYSSIAFATSSSTSVYDENNGSTTSMESTKNFDIDILRTREDFLKWNFAGDDYYAAVNGRILLNIKWMSQEKYGYQNIAPWGFSVFYDNKDVFNIYPYAGGDVEVKLGPVMLKGYYLTSIMILYTTIDGEFYFSGDPVSTEPTAYSLEDEGFEFRTGGTAVVTPIPELEIKYQFDFLRHIGYSYGMVAGVGQEFVYEGIEMKHSASISFDFDGFVPTIGVTYITYTFNPVNLFSVEGYSSSRFGFIFGVVYK
ncbi:MAG: hypothetical protein JW904_14815 [Spirochaetales bacterium]|nr:hypothetical protein [Spirochaetales bacterium]